jgi:hypothetical protein
VESKLLIFISRYVSFFYDMVSFAAHLNLSDDPIIILFSPLPGIDVSSCVGTSS